MKVMTAICSALAVLLAAFFAFVGFNKAFASIADLARYGAWTIWLPEALGRAVGWSEMGCAVGLLGALAPRFRTIARIAAAILILNQLVAAATHAAHGETGALPQNAVLIALLALVAALLPPSNRKQGEAR
jgi:predicted tellurium resistance membrane protein TerC